LSCSMSPCMEQSNGPASLRLKDVVDKICRRGSFGVVLSCRASHMRSQVLPGRKGKQCRERWHNHLNPDIIKVRPTLLPAPWCLFSVDYQLLVQQTFPMSQRMLAGVGRKCGLRRRTALSSRRRCAAAAPCIRVPVLVSASSVPSCTQKCMHVCASASLLSVSEWYALMGGSAHSMQTCMHANVYACACVHAKVHACVCTCVCVPCVRIRMGSTIRIDVALMCIGPCLTHRYSFNSRIDAALTFSTDLCALKL
jgi:hypothetical protein